MDSWGPFAFAMILPYTVSTVEGILMRPSRQTWYRTIKRAPWNPPSWVFGPVWSTLYGLMGYASYLVWLEGETTTSTEVQDKVRCALWMYGIQLFFNWLWTPIFFNFHLIGLALLDLVAVWVSVVITIYEFYAVKEFAAYLLIPYIMWGTFAMTLNLYIWLYNDADGKPKKN